MQTKKFGTGGRVKKNKGLSMKQAAIALLAGLLCIGSPTAQADSPNPFGFETQTHPLEYEYCKTLDYHFWYECSSAPRMHPDIEQINLKFVEGVGLCAIAAASFGIGKTVSLDGFKNQVTETYGPPTSKIEDEYKPGYAWSREEGFPGFGDVTSIKVYKAHRAKAYRVYLLFAMVPFDECSKAIDQKRAEAF